MTYLVEGSEPRRYRNLFLIVYFFARVFCPASLTVSRQKSEGRGKCMCFSAVHTFSYIRTCIHIYIFYMWSMHTDLGILISYYFSTVVMAYSIHKRATAAGFQRFDGGGGGLFRRSDSVGWAVRGLSVWIKASLGGVGATVMAAFLSGLRPLAGGSDRTDAIFGFVMFTTVELVCYAPPTKIYV